LTYVSASWVYNGLPQSFSETYTFSASQNNGQISQVVEGTGETVSYQYDKLKRLISSSSSAGWTQQYGYDGFGNMTSRGPGGLGYFNIAADPATNRMVGKSYDADGNLHDGNWSYDIENRLVSVDTGGGEQYMYDPSNKRIYKQNNRSLANGGGETYYFYGLDGKVVGEYSVGAMSPGQMQLNLHVESAYFGGKKVLPAVARDRLGSVRGNGSGANRPYGENYSSQNTDGFATYYQDAASGLNYADQRYYAAGYGRFATADRKRSSAHRANPTSWNGYAYALDDPINNMGPSGATTCDENGNNCSDSIDVNGDDDDPSDTGLDVYCLMYRNAGICGGTDTEPAQGTKSGDSSTKVHVTDLTKSGANYDKVSGRLGDIRKTIDPDCLSYLQSGGGNLGTYVSGLLSYGLLGVANFNPSIAAFTGTAGTDLPDGAAAIVVNNNSAFFNSGYSTDQGKITGGSAKAQVFILLHELAHALGAKDFQSDYGNKDAGKANDSKIESNCKKTLSQY
jgi:RHS repeat-associated protein